MIRIAHLSDPHFGGEMADAAEAALAATAVFEPTLTLVTGDLTLNGLPREFAAAARWLERLPAPRLVTPGNHDTPYWNLFLRALTPFDRYRRHIGPPGSGAFDAPGLTARTLNSARGAQARLNWSEGAISLRHLRRLDWSPGAAPGAVRLFACHHPLMEIEGAPVKGGVRHGPGALAELARAGVELVLTGHEHIPFVQPLPDAPEGCWAVGAGTLSRRLRGTPASFTTIIVEDDAFEIIAHGWTGAVFEPSQVWRRPRRAGATARRLGKRSPMASL
jgi:3',5'-cyclic AMP phosphodiesterase CpdA